MARAKRPASKTRARDCCPETAPGTSGRAALIGDVESQWCELSSAMALFHTRSAARRGLTLSDLQAVDILEREETVCASELADRCGLTRGAITGMLNRLERAGVARRVRDDGDGRRLLIQAVDDPSGCDCRVPEAFRDVAASFSDKDLRSIRKFLDDSSRALRDEADVLQRSQQQEAEVSAQSKGRRASV